MMRDATRVSGAGFHRYLTKPVHMDELARTLDALFRARK
jgi:DNA-binding response OmpR family regulator